VEATPIARYKLQRLSAIQRGQHACVCEVASATVFGVMLTMITFELRGAYQIAQE
jgi:hypothetical protein